MATRRRTQTAKPTTRKAPRTPNPGYVADMQNLRRGGATTPVPSGKTYRRGSRADRLFGQDA